ncbi:MAG: c-type cytochrome [Vicinamibacteria bacterium]|nr:c-type cytochrome [Vicinamibacteria bacterium]
MRQLRLAGFLTVTSVLAAPGIAAPEHKNLQVLPRTITNTQLKTMMEGFTEQLGVKCTFCHVLEQYEKDDRPHKADARRMIALVLHMKAKKALYFGPRVKDGVISCGLCHRGQAEPEPFVATLLPNLAFLAPPTPAGSRPKNLQVLAKTTTPLELQKVMDGFNGQLGVKCEFCHGTEMDKDDRPHKADARRMLRLTLDLKAGKATYFGPRVKDTVITCGMCHRGKAEPELFAP